MPTEAVLADSWIYFVRYDSKIKIGSARNPHNRFSTLRGGSPVDLEMLGVMRGSVLLERELHKRWSAQRYRYEWFHSSPDLLAFIESNVIPLREAKPFWRDRVTGRPARTDVA